MCSVHAPGFLSYPKKSAEMHSFDHGGQENLRIMEPSKGVLQVRPKIILVQLVTSCVLSTSEVIP